MCGFAGLWERPDTATASPNPADRARAMAGALPHRGPDDAGVWADEPAGVAPGFRRAAGRAGAVRVGAEGTAIPRGVQGGDRRWRARAVPARRLRAGAVLDLRGHVQAPAGDDPYGRGSG